MGLETTKLNPRVHFNGAEYAVGQISMLSIVKTIILTRVQHVSEQLSAGAWLAFRLAGVFAWSTCAGYLTTGIRTSNDSCTIASAIIRMFSANCERFHAQTTSRHGLFQMLMLWRMLIVLTEDRARDDERNLGMRVNSPSIVKRISCSPTRIKPLFCGHKTLVRHWFQPIWLGRFQRPQKTKAFPLQAGLVKKLTLREKLLFYNEFLELRQENLPPCSQHIFSREWKDLRMTIRRYRSFTGRRGINMF